MAKKEAGSAEMELDGGEAVRINLMDPDVVKYLTAAFGHWKDLRDQLKIPQTEIRELFNGAEAKGYNKKALKAAFAKMLQDESDREAELTLEEAYIAVLSGRQLDGDWPDDRDVAKKKAGKADAPAAAEGGDDAEAEDDE